MGGSKRIARYTVHASLILTVESVTWVVGNNFRKFIKEKKLVDF